jgi:copper(I)-binding protein
MDFALRRLAPLLLLGFAVGAVAQVEVKDPWVRATASQQGVSGAFMKIESREKARLVEVRSPVAERVELHETRVEQGIVRMHHVTAIALPAELKPGGYHVMLMALRRQLNAGETVPLELVVEGSDGKRQVLAVHAPVRPIHGKAAAHKDGPHPPVHGHQKGH